MRAHLVALALVAAITPAVVAQDPVRLPGMLIKAAPPPPGPKLFAGIVRDTDAVPLEGVEITIPELKRRTISGADGTFRFGDMPSGDIEMRARKLGYAAQIRRFTIEKDGGAGAFELLPWPYRVPPIVTTAARGGLSGAIADTSYVPVAEAEVRMTASNLTALTDSLGNFFLPARPGSYMVIVRKEGYADRIASVTIPEDSGRFLRAMLMPEREISPLEANNINDMQSRVIWRNKMTEPFFTREDIIKRGYTWIVDLVRAAGADQFSDDCSVIIDGGPSTRQLGTLTVEDVESVEIYGANRFLKPKSMQSGKLTTPPPARGAFGRRPGWATNPQVPITNTARANIENASERKVCPGAVYVWLR